MAQETIKSASPRGLARLAFRLPIWLYRLHLGWLLGDRLLLLTHIGRKSGLPRQTVLEVVRHDRSSDTYIIVSGFGEQVDWFRNIQHNPNVLVQSGTRRLEAVAVWLPLDVAADELYSYAQRYPRTFRTLTKRLLGQDLDGSAESCRQLAGTVPVVALRPCS
ncbi:MAG: nitroreductase family deazaflavin-dependent oxidoreductase [Roseiflexaceae bacterium]